MTALFLGLKQNFIDSLDIYYIYIHKIIDPIQIHVQEDLIYTFPLGFFSKHEAPEVDLRSKNADLQNDSENH